MAGKNLWSVSAIIAAGGSSQRLGEDKLFVLLGDEPLLARTVQPFQKCKLVDRIVVVVNKANLERVRQLLSGEKWSKVQEVCLGGERRQDSVANALKQIGTSDWVVIHDGARPLVTEDLIERGLEAASETGAAIAAVPIKDTIKVVGADCVVMGTPPRQNLWAVQTPQVFRFNIIMEAYQKAKGDATDDAALVERLGFKVKTYMGAYDNIKITTPDDLALARVLWEKHER